MVTCMMSLKLEMGNLEMTMRRMNKYFCCVFSLLQYVEFSSLKVMFPVLNWM
jgi:hypothetical protein